MPCDYPFEFEIDNRGVWDFKRIYNNYAFTKPVLLIGEALPPLPNPTNRH